MKSIPVQGASKGFFKVFGLWFKWGLFSIFLTILLINAVSIGIREKSLMPVVLDIGGRFAHMTQDLQSESLKVAENKGILVEGNVFSKFWDFLKFYSKIFFLFYGIYLWIKILSWLIGHSWFSDTSRAFVNWTAGLLIFLVLQMLFLLTTSEPLAGQTKWDLLMTPIFAFWSFIQIIPYLTTPFVNIADNFVGGNSSDFCNGSSICQV